MTYILHFVICKKKKKKAKLWEKNVYVSSPTVFTISCYLSCFKYINKKCT